MEIETRVLCELISEKQIIEFVYKNKIKLVEPYLVGMSVGGKLTLSAWQLEGGSGIGFRDFLVSEISKVSTINETFDIPHAGYNRDDTTMTEIYCRI